MPSRSRRIKRFPIIREHGVAAQLSTLVSLPVSTPSAHPVLGQPAPDFQLADHAGRVHRLHTYLARRKPVILSFYPLAGSPFCTKQLCSLRSMQLSAPTFSSAAVTILGVSQDAPERIAQFVGAHGLTYPVLSDVDRSVHDKYDVKTFLLGLLNQRTTFIIDSRGIVRGCAEGAFNYKGHIKYAERWLRRLADEDAFRSQGGAAAELVDKRFPQPARSKSTATSTGTTADSGAGASWPAAIHAASRVATGGPIRPPPTVAHALRTDNPPEEDTTSNAAMGATPAQMGPQELAPEPPTYQNVDEGSGSSTNLWGRSRSSLASSSNHAGSRSTTSSSLHHRVIRDSFVIRDTAPLSNHSHDEDLQQLEVTSEEHEGAQPARTHIMSFGWTLPAEAIDQQMAVPPSPSATTEPESPLDPFPVITRRNPPPSRLPLPSSSTYTEDDGPTTGWSVVGSFPLPSDDAPILEALRGGTGSHLSPLDRISRRASRSDSNLHHTEYATSLPRTVSPNLYTNSSVSLDDTLHRGSPYPDEARLAISERSSPPIMHGLSLDVLPLPESGLSPVPEPPAPPGPVGPAQPDGSSDRLAQPAVPAPAQPTSAPRTDSALATAATAAPVNTDLCTTPARTASGVESLNDPGLNRQTSTTDEVPSPASYLTSQEAPSSSAGATLGVAALPSPLSHKRTSGSMGGTPLSFATSAPVSPRSRRAQGVSMTSLPSPLPPPRKLRSLQSCNTLATETFRPEHFRTRARMRSRDGDSQSQGYEHGRAGFHTFGVPRPRYASSAGLYETDAASVAAGLESAGASNVGIGERWVPPPIGSSTPWPTNIKEPQLLTLDHAVSLPNLSDMRYDKRM